jgi:quercetin dioxygenase-like cupin family protein
LRLYRIEEYLQRENPNPGQRFRADILTPAQAAKDLGGVFVVLPPGTQVPYHYHRKRESIIMAIAGEAVEVVEGQETLIHAGDVLFLPPEEKHMIMNRSDKDFRFLEFFTQPPVMADFVEVP